MTKIMTSPWGAVQAAEHVADGIVYVSTASHGGFHLSEARNVQVPLAWREASFKGLGKVGWYEEDCDAAMVVLAHPGAFDADRVRRAEEFFAMWFERNGLTYKRPSVCAGSN
jgi:hypothetical protein